MTKKMLYVTKPYLPPLDEFTQYLKEIWASGILTNGGPMHQRLEGELEAYLGVKNVSLFTNATIALIIAIKALKLSGEVITTPYSFVATGHSLLWNNLTPKFIDICKDTFNLNPAKIEYAITERTSAIMPVHCYGNPCNVEEIQRIAQKHNLKVIYDAAHAFGVKKDNQSILNFGDISVLSFHATKVFNTFEGGAIICNDIDLKKKIDYLKNFGFENEIQVEEVGINGKMSEINSAFGILQLQYIDQAIESRRKIFNQYLKQFKNCQSIRLLKINEGVQWNYSYFPIIIDDAHKYSRDEVYNRLKDRNIFSRRYFYPLISDLPMYEDLAIGKDSLPMAEDTARKVLCLPIYPGLDFSEINEIVELVIF